MFDMSITTASSSETSTTQSDTAEHGRPYQQSTRKVGQRLVWSCPLRDGYLVIVDDFRIYHLDVETGRVSRWSEDAIYPQGLMEDYAEFTWSRVKARSRRFRGLLLKELYSIRDFLETDYTSTVLVHPTSTVTEEPKLDIKKKPEQPIDWMAGALKMYGKTDVFYKSFGQRTVAILCLDTPRPLTSEDEASPTLGQPHKKGDIYEISAGGVVVQLKTTGARSHKLEKLEASGWKWGALIDEQFIGIVAHLALKMQMEAMGR